MGCPTVDFENGPVFTPWYKQYTPYIWVKYFVKLILLLQSHPIYIIFTPWVNWWLKYTQWYIGQSTTFFLDVNHPVVLSLQDFYRIPTRRFDWTTDIGVPNPKSETSRSALLVTKMPVISISLDSPPPVSMVVSKILHFCLVKQCWSAPRGVSNVRLLVKYPYWLPTPRL
jgi:hypothetical protein